MLGKLWSSPGWTILGHIWLMCSVCLLVKPCCLDSTLAAQPWWKAVSYTVNCIIMSPWEHLEFTRPLTSQFCHVTAKQKKKWSDDTVSVTGVSFVKWSATQAFDRFIFLKLLYWGISVKYSADEICSFDSFLFSITGILIHPCFRLCFTFAHFQGDDSIYRLI